MQKERGEAEPDPSWPGSPNKSSRNMLDAQRPRATAYERAGSRCRAAIPAPSPFHPPYPLTIVKGEGYTLTDLDGNTYIDVLNNYTSLIHGHAFAPITEAVTAQLQHGTNYAAALEAQAELAERLTSRVQSVDKVRFTNSGTEATMMAIRGARAYTGRELIVKMEGGYHGTFDDFEVSMHPPVDSGPDGSRFHHRYSRCPPESPANGGRHPLQ